MADSLSRTSILTHSGIFFDPCAPDPADVRLEDIAVSLSRMPRWSGSYARSVEWPVALHSLFVCDLVTPVFKLTALLHDATEAYFGGDLPAPVKRALPAYRELERLVWEKAIAPRFELPHRIPDEVHEADMRARVTEARDLFEPRGVDKRTLGWSWLPDLAPYGPPLEGRMFREPNRIDRTVVAFLDAFSQIQRQR